MRRKTNAAVSEFYRLSSAPFGHLREDDPNMSMPGMADLSPLKNKAREAVDALNDAQKAADAGKAEDAKQALQRAKASIDAALGGQVAPGGAVGGNFQFRY